MKLRPLPRLVWIALSLGALALPLISRAADSAGGLQSGDLIGICGDSITEQKMYTVDMADYFMICQPQSKLGCIQFGWSGETAPGFLSRMTTDATPFKPTVATTCYGMNDGHYAPTNPDTIKTYRTAMKGVVDTLKASGVRFIVIGSPSPVDTYCFRRPKDLTGVNEPAIMYNHTLADLGQVGKELAEQENVGFADLHATMLDVMAKAKAANGESFPVSGAADGVHPQADGHLIMAYTFLKALGCDGNIGTITVDMMSNHAEATEGTTVISDTGGMVELESTRYPFCFYGDNMKDPNSTRSILPFLPFNQDLNRYMLVVKNASAKSLKVTWGTASKTFTSDQLATGVNLAAEFLDNPFSAPFRAAQQKIADQQAFETFATKELLHSFLTWQRFPEGSDIMKSMAPQLTDKVVAKWKSLSDASAAAVVPVKHEIKIEAAN